MNAEDQSTLNSSDTATITDNREGPPVPPLYPMVSAHEQRLDAAEQRIVELGWGLLGVTVFCLLSMGFLALIAAGILVALQAPR